ncbi:MAG: nickel-dependent lactate racemase [Phycisphaerae bacterium]|nr:nickel-dependent lactate racemase [Phycisphaerae bacterium]
MTWFKEQAVISPQRLMELTEKVAAEAKARICPDPKRVLLLPPDITRAHSESGKITERLYQIFSETADVHLIPTLGQHVPHTPEQNRWMFGSVPEEKIHVHDWRDGSKVIGEVPAEYVKEVSGGKADWAIPVSLNRMLLEEEWDLIINVGHVVPHEVLGFANHNKNYFIGLGGKEMICASHMMAACCGIENNLGQLITPLRACYNKAETEYLSHLPHCYAMVVMKYADSGELVHTGFFAGEDQETYMEAARLSQAQNINTFDEPIDKVVAVMQGDEFFSTWVANKAVYRTRMVIADGGELLVIAPGLERFGEQEEVDQLIRKYGYSGTEKVMKAWRENDDLQDLTHGTAHLIHGSSEGRFKITYAPGHLTKEEVEGVNFEYADIDEMTKRYDPAKMKNGWNVMPDGEKVYYISTPSAGLWSTSDKMDIRES